MYTPRRVLYVTISNWGVGDELAMRGTLMLMREALPGHLTFFAEKNEAIRALPDQPFKLDLWSDKLHRTNLDFIVHAGGNQWSGPNHAAWEDWTIESKVPVLYLGAGMWNNKADKAKTRKVMEHCHLFAGRDEVACRAAKEVDAQNVHLLCCPSLFIEPETPVGDRVGLVYQAHQEVGPHSVTKELADAEIALYRRVCANRPSLIICHFIGDFVSAIRVFPEWKDRIVYSKLLDDYIGWYKQCNRIVTMRLHGAYLGATLGRPTCCIKAGESKICAMKQIAVPVVEPGQCVTTDAGQFSKPTEVRALRANYLAAYRQLLREAVR